MSKLEESIKELKATARAVVERWDSPNWKDLPHTAEYINKLRNSLRQTDQLYCQQLYGEWMYHEAAERGYDASAASRTKNAYTQACVEYKENWKEEFTPQ